MTVKIFAMNDTEWWAAETVEEAITDFCATYSCTREEAIEDHFIDGPVEALSDDQMDELVFSDEDLGLMSFRAKLANLVESGATFPNLFATTEY